MTIFEVVGGLNEIIHAKQLAQCLPCGELSMNDSYYILTIVLGPQDNIKDVLNTAYVIKGVISNIFSIILRTLGSVQQVGNYKIDLKSIPAYKMYFSCRYTNYI